MKQMAQILLALLVMGGSLWAADTYTVDTVHSSVVFKVKRMGVVNVYGRFNGLEGKVVMDSANPASGAVNLKLKAENVDTNNERRDNHLRSPDFFNAAQFPEITFNSTQIKKISDHLYEVTGDLSLHGTTRSIVTQVEHVGSGNHPRSGASLVGFETRFAIRRSDFGMNFMLDALSDEIEITLAVHGVTQ